MNDSEWVEKISEKLVGKKIVGVSYMSSDEADAMGWRRAVVIELDDGTLIWPSMDDEGNDAGALFGDTASEFWVAPVLR